MDTNKEIDRIFRVVDTCLFLCQIEEIDMLLSKVDTDNITILVAWLTITMPAKDRLVGRDRLISRVRELEPDRADRLLKGLQ
jgi:hypothetical protein